VLDLDADKADVSAALRVAPREGQFVIWGSRKRGGGLTVSYLRRDAGTGALVAVHRRINRDPRDGSLFHDASSTNTSTSGGTSGGSGSAGAGGGGPGAEGAAPEGFKLWAVLAGLSPLVEALVARPGGRTLAPLPKAALIAMLQKDPLYA
jgi:hypothetical protein